MTKVIVVTGASGMLGGSLFRNLKAAVAPAEGWSGATKRTPSGLVFRSRSMDLEITERVGTVFHCAAMTDADACEREPEEAWSVNAMWPAVLAAQAASVGARFVYVSTDAVYDDRTPGRLSREDDPPRPLSVYAETKLAGEQAVLQAHPGATVVRTTMFGWTLPGKREKLAEQIIRGLATQEPLRLWGDAIFSPLHVRDLAIYLSLISKLAIPGVLNLGARDAVSKADFGRMIASSLHLDSGVIEETSVDDTKLLATRTKNTALDVSRAEELLGRLPRVRDGVEHLAQEMGDGTVMRIKGGTWLS